MTTYNGWTNRETWLVNVHFNPETRADLESAKGYLEEEEEKLPTFFKNYIDLSLINWDELAEALDSEMESNDGDDE